MQDNAQAWLPRSQSYCDYSFAVNTHNTHCIDPWWELAACVPFWNGLVLPWYDVNPAHQTAMHIRKGLCKFAVFVWNDDTDCFGADPHTVGFTSRPAVPGCILCMMQQPCRSHSVGGLKVKLLNLSGQISQEAGKRQAQASQQPHKCWCVVRGGVTTPEAICAGLYSSGYRLKLMRH